MQSSEDSTATPNLLEKVAETFEERRGCANFVVPQTSGTPEISQAPFARIAQLVEHNLAKVGVASSNLVSRSTKASHFGGLFSLWGKGFSGSETWEFWLVKQRLTSLHVFNATDGAPKILGIHGTGDIHSFIDQISAPCN